jgi:putative flippase GtrA
VILAQFGLYLVVGGLSFFVDIGAFVALRAIELPLYLASAASFALATMTNYFLSYLLAFKRGRFARGTELARLFVVAGIGLALNTGFVWLFLRLDLFSEVLAKIAAVPLVLAWNFLGRRIFVFRPELPDGTAVLVDRVSGRNGRY